MEFNRVDLEYGNNPNITIEGPVEFEPSLRNHNRFTNLRDVFVRGHGYYDYKTAEFIVGLNINYKATVLCAISLNPIDIDLETTFSETFVFDESAEAGDFVYIEDEDLDLKPYIWSSILADIPLNLVDPSLDTYPSGPGWEVLSEVEFQKQKENKIDPRLEKLKEFKFD